MVYGVAIAGRISRFRNNYIKGRGQMKPEGRKRLKQHIEMIVEHKEPTQSQTGKILRDAVEEQIKGKLELEDKNRELRLKLYTLLRKEAEEQRFIWWIWNVYAKNVNDLILSIISATTYDNETMAKLGKYGLPMKCFEFLERVKEGTDIIYGSDRIYDGTYLNVEISADVKKGIPENKPEPSNSDVSTTQDVSIDVKTGQSVEIETCSWIQEDDPEICYWKTRCGNSFYFTEGTPADNRMKYCCYCGKLLKQED